MRKLYTGKRFLSLLPALLIMASTLFLSACGTGDGYNKQPWEDRDLSAPAQETPSDISVSGVERESLDAPKTGEELAKSGLAPVKVALLLPLSGQHAKLGQSMLQASQMALFDLGYDNFNLLPKDTKGTPEGARAAAKSALQDGAKLVLGPVFSASVQAARDVTERADINMIAFSTDWTLANRNTFLIGFLPFDQVERVVRFASNQGYKRLGVLSPQDSYGNAVISAYQSVAQDIGVETARVTRLPVSGSGMTSTMREFTEYDKRKNAANKAATLPYDAILMPVGGATARQVGSFLNHYDMPPRAVKRLGTGLMDEASLATDRTLAGTWFAAPAPQARTKFERRYRNLYGAKPPRIASLAYDATALSAILARMGLEKNNRPAYDHRSLTNPNGFAGVDGIFRFRPDGISERGLAVLEYRNGKIVTIDPAPQTFQRVRY